MKPLLFSFVALFAGCSSGKQKQRLQNSTAVAYFSSNNYGAKADNSLPFLALQDANGNR